MKVICQRCHQILPHTAVMCPNCGNRLFSAIDDSTLGDPTLAAPHGTPNPWQPQTPSPSPQLAPQPAYAPPAEPPPMPTPQASYPATQPSEPIYMPPVAPPVSLPPTYRSGQSGQKLASHMEYAGFFRRGFAYAFDLVLVSLLLALAYQLGLPKLAAAMGVRSFNDQTIALLGWGGYLFYMALFTSLGRQATIGKIIMGLWVFGMQGQRINFFQALFRECLKLLLLPMFFIMWFTDRKQTLADLIARTVVLYDPH